MISDVLSETIDKIEEYQREMPSAYDKYEYQITACKLAMRQLQYLFDIPPDIEFDEKRFKKYLIDIDKLKETHNDT